MLTLPFTVKTFNFKNLHFSLAWSFTFHCHHVNILIFSCFLAFLCVLSFLSRQLILSLKQRNSSPTRNGQCMRLQFSFMTLRSDNLSMIFIVSISIHEYGQQYLLNCKKSDKNQVATYTKRPDKKKICIRCTRIILKNYILNRHLHHFRVHLHVSRPCSMSGIGIQQIYNCNRNTEFNLIQLIVNKLNLYTYGSVLLRATMVFGNCNM